MFSSYERANIAFRLVYGIEPLSHWDSDDSDGDCELAVLDILRTLHGSRNTNPLKKKFKTYVAFHHWFNKKYPRHSVVEG